MNARAHGWRLLRIALKYRLLDLLRIEPLAQLSLPGWLRLLARITGSRTPAQALGPRLCQALIELGPVYIKLGQLLSTRRDVVPAPIADALEQLQDAVPPVDSRTALAVLARSLGKPVAEVFDWIDPIPLAAASIAQVHAARLRDGTEVVIKIRRPDIEGLIDETLTFLRAVALTAERRSAVAHRLRLAAVIDDYDRTIHAELDLAQEARNTAQLRANFAHSPMLYVPRPWLQYSSREVLVLERIHGVPVSDNAALDAAGVDKALLADRGVRTFFKQVFVDNFFHADMHPGNVFVDLSKPEDPKYIALDCAIIGSLTEADQTHLAKSLLAFFNRDYTRVAQLYVDHGWAPPDTDVGAFAVMIGQACEPHFAKPLGEISFGAFLTDLFRTAESFDIHMQPQLVLLQKTLLYVEGLGRSLYPQLDLWTTAKPFMETWLLERHGPAAAAGRLLRDLPDLLASLAGLPQWLAQARTRLRSLEALQAEQVRRITRLEAEVEGSRSRRRRQVRAAAVLIVAGALILAVPVPDAADTVSNLRTSAGALGTLGGVVLLLRTLI